MALGDLFAIIFFEKNIAALAIFHVSLGDTVASLVGQQWGKKKLPFNPRKSWLGTFSYVAVTFIGGLFFLAPLPALLIACLGALVEALPLHNFDNLLIPVTVSIAAKFFL